MNKYSTILNNSSQLPMMIAARTVKLLEVSATVRTQSNNSSKNQMNNTIHQWIQPDEHPTPPPPAPSTNESANSTITIEKIRDEIMKISDKILTEVNNQKRLKPPPFQGKVNGENVTYCWSHCIFKNPWHNKKTCKRKKEGH